MKLRLSIYIFLIFILFLVNDTLNYVKYKVETYLFASEQRALLKVESEPAVVVLGDTDLSRIVTNISNQYFVASVKVLEQKELVDMLSEQYRLNDSQKLLEELHLPRVLEVNFIPESFHKVESGLFLKSINELTGVIRLLYSEENYLASWESLEQIKELRNIISKYWTYFYYGCGFFILLAIFAMRVDYENLLAGYWAIYRKAGGIIIYKTISRILSSIFTVVIPALSAMALEYFLNYKSILQLAPDINYHLIRFMAGILISFAALLITRKKFYA